MNLVKRLRTPIQIAFGVVAIGFLVYFVVQNWSDVRHELAQMDPAWVVAALALAFAATVMFMLNWRSIVRSFGYRVSVRRASEITFISQIGKYIPGGIWPTVAASQMGSAAGVPATTMAVTMVMQMGIQLVTATVVSVGALFLVPTLAHRYWWLIMIVLIIGLAVLLPPVMRRVLTVVFTLIRRKDLLPQLSRRHLGAAILWALGAWVAFGLHLWLLFSAASHFGISTLIPAISGYALSWAIGFLAVFAPAGAGVREGILVLLFGASYGAAVVLGVAVVSRIEMVVVDVVLFGAGMALRAFDRRRSAERAPQPAEQR